MIANPGYGIAEYTLGGDVPDVPAQPPAKRDYDGLEFRLRKRLSNRWSMNTSYTYSHLRRQLLRPDELGRERPQQSRASSGSSTACTCRSTRTATRSTAGCRPIGRTTSSSRAPTTCRGAPMVGVEYRAASGTLQQSTITYKSVPVFDEARGNLGRTPIYSRRICSCQQDVPLPGRTRMNVGVNVINLFDQDTVTRLFQTRYRDHDRGHHRRPVLPGLRPCRARRQPWPAARCAVQPVGPVPRRAHDSRAGDAALLGESRV